MPSVAEFKAAYSAFLYTDADVVSAKLALAAQRTDAAVYGTKYGAAVMARCAQLLALEPGGEGMRTKGGGTVYDESIKEMKRTAVNGWRTSRGWTGL